MGASRDWGIQRSELFRSIGRHRPPRVDFGLHPQSLDAPVYATQARGPGMLRAYRSAWRQYEGWCVRLGLPALNGDPRLVGMYLTAAAERLAAATLASPPRRHRHRASPGWPLPRPGPPEHCPAAG